MVKRLVASALRPLANFRTSLTEPVAARHFSSTPSYGVRAVFAETQNTELNQVLSTIQEKIIFPAYLPEKQRELVFDPKMRQQLQQNPIVIELDGLEHKFSTIDRFSEVPNSKKIMIQALKLMKNKEDWDNLETLLAGYHKAGIKLQKHHYARIVRMAGVNGNAYSIIECAKQSHKTGMTLQERESVVQLLTRINEKIMNSSENSSKEAAQALKWTELVIDLLQRPEHMAETAQPADKLHNSPFVRGLVLFTQASVIQIRQQAGQSVEAELKTLTDSAELLISIWGRLDTNDLSKLKDVQDLNPFSEKTRSTKKYDNALSGGSYVQTLAQNIKGIALTRELVGDAASGLKPVEEALQQHLQDFVAEGQKEGQGAGWAAVYERATGQKPDWSAAPAKEA